MKQLTVTQSDYDAMEKEVASMAKKLENMGEKVDAKEKASLDLEVSEHDDCVAGLPPCIPA